MPFVHFLLYIQKIFSYMRLIPQVQFSREVKNSVSPLTESPLTQSSFVHSPPKPPPPGPPLLLSVTSPGQPGATQKTPLTPESLPASKGRGEGLPIKGEATHHLPLWVLATSQGIPFPLKTLQAPGLGPITSLPLTLYSFRGSAHYLLLTSPMISRHEFCQIILLM